MLRALFGPSRREVWAALAAELGAEAREGGLFASPTVRAQVRDWALTLDTYTVSNGKTSQTYTRLRAPFLNEEGFRLTVRPQHLLDAVGALIGLQDVTVGDARFDAAHVVKTNDEERARQVLGRERVRRLIERARGFTLTIADHEGAFGPKYGAGVDVLQATAPGVQTDLARLKSAFLLFAELLDEICHGARAYEELPGRGADSLVARGPPLAGAAYLQGLRAKLAVHGGVVERVGDDVVAVIPSPSAAFAGEARVYATIPTLPALQCDLVLEGALPPSPRRVGLAPRGLLARARPWTGVPAIDQALAVTAHDDDAPFVARLAAPLLRLVALEPVATFDEEHVGARVEDVDAERASDAVDALVELWRAAVAARLAAG